MNLARLSINRPIFIVCIFISILAMGYLSLKKLPVDLFPDVTFPIVVATTIYPGAGPEEIETLVSEPIEDELSTLSGIKTLRSINADSVSTVVAEFTLETDVKYAEQQIRDRISAVKRKLPDDAEDSIIRRIDPADQPVAIVALRADLPVAQMFELADRTVKMKFAQIANVGLVEVLGGREREIKVELDRDKLRNSEVSASLVAARIESAGKNIPAGTYSKAGQETVFRTVAEFTQLKDIEETVITFFGNEVPVRVKDVAKVTDSLVDEKSRTMVNGSTGLLLMVFRQSGANTIKVVDSVHQVIAKLNTDFANTPGKPQLTMVRDGAKPVRWNVDDVKESILVGVLLTVLVVFFFLGSGRSTLITGMALPNSLLGAFILMSAAGFSINVMTLLALSLAVGLLIDDAIVVRENIFRHLEMGAPPKEAAERGTKEVTLAVIATTLAVVAVFAPIAFLSGVVGQFFREFGLTICFAMLISLFDAMTMAPMMSAYLASAKELSKDGGGSLYNRTIGGMLRGFDRFQTRLENSYSRLLEKLLRKPLMTLGGAFLIFALSLASLGLVKKNFLPAQDIGEFMIALELPAGTSLAETHKLVESVDAKLRSHKEVDTAVAITGDRNAASHVAQIFVTMVPKKQRSVNTLVFKDTIREELKEFAHAKPKVQDIDMVMGGMRPFTVNVIGDDVETTRKAARALFEKLKGHAALKDVAIGDEPGKPEYQVVVAEERAQRLGVATAAVGGEMRALIEGVVPAVLRQSGQQYDIRVRLQEDQRDLRQSFNDTLVPNVNNRLVRLSDVAKPVERRGPSDIRRENRGRYIQISADIAPEGPGMDAGTTAVKTFFASEYPKTEGLSFRFVGQAENFQELQSSMMLAMVLGALFIFLVLSSLYESFITPFTIMLVLPLAATGAFFGLLVTNKSLDLFSMIGAIMLMGISTKNSILLVDYTKQLMARGVERNKALIEAGRVRLRPILMTTFALIAGMLPVAIGLNEASSQRTSMGVAVIGGLISSTVLTLVVIPAAFIYMDRFAIWIGGFLRKLAGKSQDKGVHVRPAVADSPDRKITGETSPGHLV